MLEMDYEYALRYVFSCERHGGPEKLADADIFRICGGERGWGKVSKGLKYALEEINRQGDSIKWTPAEELNGNNKPHFEVSLKKAIKLLGEKNDPMADNPARLYAVISSLTNALGAATRKLNEE